MREHEVNKLDNFIMGWYHDDTSFVDSIVDHFHSNEQLTEVGTIGDNDYDPSIKDSTDLPLTDPHLLPLYRSNIRNCIQLYTQKYRYSIDQISFTIGEHINIQHYRPGGGYPAWHCERAMCLMPNVARHLFFITYLNDVSDQGETEFFHQKVKIKPEKGLTIVAPTDWTFTHKGTISPSQDKMIVTGWLHIMPTEEQMKVINKNADDILEQRKARSQAKIGIYRW